MDTALFDGLMAQTVGDISLPPALAVAVSGGVDSMALTLLMQDYCHSHNITLHALHVDHRLRSESTAEAIQVQAWLHTRGINCVILTPAIPINSMQGNKMHNARLVRYQLMQDYCSTHDIAYLCVAHHLEDQAETVLMRLGRGCGVNGLAGMRPLSKRDEITLLRPLLSIPKARLKTYLTEKQQPWIEDPTNNNSDYTRTHMRHLLPTLAHAGIATQRIADTAAHMARSADFMQHYMQAWLEEQGCIANGFYASLPMHAWSALHPEMQLRTLRHLLEKITPLGGVMRFSALNAAREAMLQPERYKTRSLHGCVIVKYQMNYLIAQEMARMPPPTPLQLEEENIMLGVVGKQGIADLKSIKIVLPLVPNIVLMTIPALWHLDELIAVPYIKYIHPAWKKLTYHLHNVR